MVYAHSNVYTYMTDKLNLLLQCLEMKIECNIEIEWHTINKKVTKLIKGVKDYSYKE